MTLLKAQSIYFVGIRGVGMCGLALACHQMGKRVMGSDAPTSVKTATARALEQNSIEVYDNFDASHIDSSIDLVITPALHGGEHNVESKKAIELDIETISYARALGELTQLCACSISVCGTHGKTTSTALLASVLIELQKHVTHVVGAAEFNDGLMGGGSTGLEYGVFEADEYVTSVGDDQTPKFLYHHPTHVLCTNIDFDHPDVFASLDNVKNAFEAFFTMVSKKNGVLVYCLDDPILSEVVEKIDIAKFSYGIDSGEYQAKNIVFTSDSTIFDIEYNGTHLTHIDMKLLGRHNVCNVTGVAALCNTIGLPIADVVRSIAKFQPAQRRMQKLYENKIVVLDDYAHHPTEIDATLDAVRSAYPGRRIIMIFQLHTFSRTLALESEFQKSLTGADKVFLLPIYGSVREHDVREISTQEFVDHAKQKGIHHLIPVDNNRALSVVEDEITDGDIVLTVGAGDDIVKLKDALIYSLKQKL